jgi:phospholipid N-methyltransferase
MASRLARQDPKRPPDHRLAFFQGFLKRPMEVASIIPSSRFLMRRVVRCADVASARLLVELGPGTGGSTRTLLRAMRPDAKLLAIEINPTFVRLLQASIRDPRLIVHEGSAADVGRALREHGLGQPDVVLSGIPFSTITKTLGRQILASVREALKPGGRFVAYQARDRVEILGREVFGRARVQMELLNVPPMRVYRWDSPSRTTSPAPHA